MLKNKRIELMANLVPLVIGIILFINAQGIETGAAMAQGGDFMPKLCSGILIGLSILLLINSYVKRNVEPSKTAKKSFEISSFIGFLKTFVLIFVYILLIEPIGFVIVSAVYLFLQMLLFTPKRKRNFLLMTVISIIAPIFVNYIFVNVFSLILPAGLLK